VSLSSTKTRFHSLKAKLLAMTVAPRSWRAERTSKSNSPPAFSNRISPSSSTMRRATRRRRAQANRRKAQDQLATNWSPIRRCLLSDREVRVEGERHVRQPRGNVRLGLRRRRVRLPCARVDLGRAASAPRETVGPVGFGVRAVEAQFSSPCDSKTMRRSKQRRGPFRRQWVRSAQAAQSSSVLASLSSSGDFGGIEHIAISSAIAVRAARRASTCEKSCSSAATR
jgi:hypothetical protein